VNSVGIVTARDNFTIHETKNEVTKTIEEFINLDDESARKRFKLGADVRDWQVNFAKSDLQKHYPDKGKLCKISYRPFDDKWTFYTGKSKGFHCYPRNEVMQHFVKGQNFGLSLCKQFKSGETYQHVFITNKIIESSLVSNRTSEITSVFPLYLYHDKQKSIQSFQFTAHEEAELFGDKNNPTESLILEEPQFAYRSLAYRPNLSQKIVRAIEKSLGISFIIQEFKSENIEFGEVDILDYIYAVLHSPNYREKYKEFLKIDFPRVPYPKDKETFWQLVKLGGELRQIHLFENPIIEKYVTQYPIGGNNFVAKPRFIATEIKEQVLGSVFINESQYFANVPEVAWNFYIGGYQPAQKWLKDRNGRKLEFEDILHYQKIIVALTETFRLMTAIGKINIE
jgi:predicted helicase